MPSSEPRWASAGKASGRNTADHGFRFHITRHDRAGRDSCSVADGTALEHDRSCTDQYA